MLVEIITILAISISISTGYISPNDKDLPISYQYNAYHLAPSYRKDEKDLSYGYSESYTPVPPKVQSMQYAPLLKSGWIQLHNAKPNKVLYNDDKAFEVKKHLEPRLEELPTAVPTTNSLQQKTYPLTHFDYIPGKNVQVLRSINRISGHNAVYRTFADEEMAQAERIKKINYLNKYVPEQSTVFCNNPDHTIAIPQSTTTPSTTTPQTTTPVESLLGTFHESKQYYIPRPIKYVVEKQISPEKNTVTRMRSMLLNVARYNMAVVPNRVMNSGVNPSLLEQVNLVNLNQRPLLNVPGSTDLGAPATEHKTFLYPIHKNILFSTKN
ncbi:hypothetical protein NE865_02829 [Phthorimaea operculella]|nr:hypothetical protein NE865_02829 [Phthorimaea operculella]